jgi:hypothetical protein
MYQRTAPSRALGHVAWALELGSSCLHAFPVSGAGRATVGHATGRRLDADEQAARMQDG